MVRVPSNGNTTRAYKNGSRREIADPKKGSAACRRRTFNPNSGRDSRNLYENHRRSPWV
jgi:hypothetical protein